MGCMAKTNGNGEKVKSMESWIWDAACSIRGAADAAKFKDYILPLIFVKRLCDVFDDEIDRIAETYKAFKEVDKFSRLVGKDEIVKNDYNISPSRYIQVNDARTYRPIEEIVEELREQESEYVTIDAEMKTILTKLGFKYA
ncbi:N-6 DNA methylase [groundwater metagenome]